jgi:hypothetical protein
MPQMKTRKKIEGKLLLRNWMKIVLMVTLLVVMKCDTENETG